MPLHCVEVATANAITHSVVWLHGLGADGHDFEPIVPELDLGDLGIRFVFPHAPKIPVSINGGMVMPAWYDIRVLDLKRDHDVRGLEASANELGELVARERERGIPSDRVFVAGFSQGGAVALHYALREEAPLCGVIALSTYLIETGDLESMPGARIPRSVFQGHGSLDPMVGIDRGRAARARLERIGYDVDWHEYPIPHSVCLEEIQSLGAWMRTRISVSPAEA
ncbi:MAG: carboxylesterase [Planctomycetes bacterium]|nr:carboxylesterase [Planctomycetota bacterium]